MRLSVGLLLSALVAVLPATGQEPNHRDLLNAFEKQLKAVVATSGPSIATVVVSRSEQYPKARGADDTPGRLGGYDPKELLKDDPSLERARLAKSLDLADPETIPDHGYAGGVVIDPTGLVLTPYHVIDGATRVYVYLPGGAGSYADILAADARSDLAVLKLIMPPPGLKAIKFAEVRTTDRGGRRANVTTGKLAVLIANPYSSEFGLARPSATFGGITNVRYRIASAEEDDTSRSVYRYGTLLEYAGLAGGVLLNAGLTGGVLLNLDGEMIGLTTTAAVVPAVVPEGELRPGYAIPADENFLRVVATLRTGVEVEYGFLGVTRRLRTGEVVIDTVTPQGPAALAGLLPGDEIVRINDVPITSFNDLLYHIGHGLAGSKVTITALRNRRPQEFEVTLAKFRHDQPFIASVRPEPVFGLRVDYGSILAQQLGRVARVAAGGVDPGVSVREVVADSPAAVQFKTLGDPPTRWLITHVNGAAVTTPAEFYKTTKGQPSVKLTVVDPTELNRRPRELTLP
jgi:serine protease Do